MKFETVKKPLSLILALIMLVTTVVISTATLADNTPVKIATTSNVNKDQNYGHTLTSVNVTDPQISSCFTNGTTATSRDISNLFETGYLRLYIKAPKSIKVRLYLITSDWSRSNSKYEISLIKTTDNAGYYEYRIPLSELKGTNIDWSAKQLSMVAIVPAEGADESAFLTSSESLFISPIELWDGEPTDNLTQSIIPEKIAVTSYVEEQSNYINKTTVDVESSDPIYSSYTKATKFTITDGFIISLLVETKQVCIFQRLRVRKLVLQMEHKI